MKVLVVEDNEERMGFFRELFLEDQMTFTTTSREAIALLMEVTYEIIFLDIDLDDGLGRGLEVARSLKGSPNDYSPLIVHSMNVSAASKVERISPGSLLMPIIEMRQIFAQFGKDELLERFFE